MWVFEINVEQGVETRFNASELKIMTKLVEQNIELFVNQWDEYFNN